MHYVYIISNSKNIFYKGYSTDPHQRLIYHNNGLSTYTKDKGPWKLVFIQQFDSKEEALNNEKMLKRQNHSYLEWLIKSERNIITAEGRLG